MVRGELNLRLVQWLRLWGARMPGCKPELQCGRARALQAPLCTVNCKRCDPFVRRGKPGMPANGLGVWAAEGFENLTENFNLSE